jgi:hypothetical protein
MLTARRAWWGAGMLTLGILAALWAGLPRAQHGAERALPPAAQKRATSALPAAVSTAPIAAPTPSAAPQPATGAEVRLAAQPRVRVSPTRVSVRRDARAAARQRQSEAVDPSEELRLLTPARQLLATETTRALALADEHARRFPHGVFAEERAFLRIEALLRLSRRQAAEAEAQRFRHLHPQSTYLERLNQLLATQSQP